jgi:transposase
LVIKHTSSVSYELGFLRFCGLSFPSTRRGRHGKSSRGIFRYDSEFKRNAVALVKGGRPINQVARDLGVSDWSLRHWIRLNDQGQELKEPATLGSETPEQRELRQENEYLRRQRDILKKPLGILSAEMPQNASR